MKKSALRLVLVSQLLASASALAAPRIFIFSGGGSPWHNQYSQWLQTKTLADGMRQRFGAAAVEAMFGAGNSDHTPRLFPDVHAKMTENGTVREKIIYGAIPGNRTATEKEAKTRLAKALSGTAKDKPFFLFVSDHGFPNPKADEYEDNCIHTWSYDFKEMAEAPLDKQCLSQTELSGLIRKNRPQGTTVFAMSQCFSGGFHRMSVALENTYPTANTAVCGFTSVSEDLMASGCTDDVEADRYQGYERYFTEMLTGRDVVTGRGIAGGARKTVRDAHRAATLVDMTVDVPMATSDYYLLSWYYAIFEGGFRPRGTNADVAALREKMDGMVSLKVSTKEMIQEAGPLGNVVRDRLEFLSVHAAALGKYRPERAQLYVLGTEQQLQERYEAINGELDRLDKRDTPLAKRKNKILFRQLYKPWKQAVAKNAVSGLSEAERNFEREYLAPLWEQARSYDNPEGVYDTVFIQRLAHLTEKDPAAAAALADYKLARVEKMTQWAFATGNAKLARLAKELQRISATLARDDETYDGLLREQSHVRRVLESRQEIAALVALGIMRDQKAIDEVLGLERCEGTGF